MGGEDGGKSARSARQKSAKYSTHDKEDGESSTFEKKSSPPEAAPGEKQKTERRLLRKSTSASLLDVDGPGDDPAAHKLPKLRRKSSRLRDLTADEEAAALKAKQEEKPKVAKRSSRGIVRRTSTWKLTSQHTMPPLTPKSGREHSTYQPDSPDQPKRRKRPGDIDLLRQPTIKVVVKYQLGQNELKKFKLCFKQIDLDQSGFIDYDEFFEFIDERKTPFSEGLFRMIDADSNGTIDYEEFVHATVMYCMYTRDEILQFAFDTFDPGTTGGIGEKEFKRLINLVSDGKPAYPGNFNSALAEFDRNKDGEIDFEEFKVLNKRYPMLLFPCFRLQDRMQKATLGEKHWHKLHKRLYDRLKLQHYQRKHNGALPPLGVVGSIRKFLGIDNRDLYIP